jgi:PAS domain S-box-containing protein
MDMAGNLTVNLGALLAQAPAALYVAEPGVTGQRLFVSDHIEVISGHPPRSWTASPTLWRDVIHPQDVAGRLSDEAYWASCEPDGRVVSSEYRLIRRDGQTAWVRDVARLTTLEGRPVWIGVLHDISESRGVLAAAADGEAHYRSVAEWCPDALLQLDLEGRIIYASPATNEIAPGLFGFHAGQSWLGLVHPEDREQARLFADALSAGHDARRLQFRTGGGDAEYLEATGRPIRAASGAPSGIALSIRRADRVRGQSRAGDRPSSQG